jgi:hypothetical protein
LYPGYADSWRVSQQTSLFTYASGTDTETYTDRSFPHAPTSLATLPDRTQAQTVCAQAGITDPLALDDCELDVGLTGDPQFALAPQTTPAQQMTGAITIGGPPVAAVITAPGSSARLNFTGTAGQQVFVKLSGSTFPSECGLVQLQAADGTVLADGCTSGASGSLPATVLPATGQYSLLVAPNDDGTGTVDVQVLGDTNHANTITADGPPVTAVLSQPGAKSVFTFLGTPGEKVFVALSGSTFPGQCDLVELDDPAGSELSDACTDGATGDVDGTSLAATGTYSLVVRSADNDTGQVTLRLITDHDQRGTVTPDGPPVMATVGQPGAESRFTFSAHAGQKVALEVTGSTFPGQCDLVEIDGPDGSELNDACTVGATGSMTGTALPTTGTYTVLVNPAGPDTGQLTFRLIADHDQQGTISPGGPSVTATVGQLGAESSFSFGGRAGEKVSVDISGATFPDQCGLVDLDRSDGGALAIGCTTNGSGTISSFALPATGQYKVVVDPPNETGRVTLRLLSS